MLAIPRRLFCFLSDMRTAKTWISLHFHTVRVVAVNGMGSQGVKSPQAASKDSYQTGQMETLLSWATQSLKYPFSFSCECPVYKKKRKGLTLLDILPICTNSSIDVRIPYPKSNSIFVMKLKEVNEKYLSCDDSGSYKNHSSPTAVVEVSRDDKNITGIETISRKRLPADSTVLSRKDVYTIKRTVNGMIEIGVENDKDNQ